MVIYCSLRKCFRFSLLAQSNFEHQCQSFNLEGTTSITINDSELVYFFGQETVGFVLRALHPPHEGTGTDH